MSDAIPLPLLVRPKEAARLLSLDRSTVYVMMQRGELPYVMYGRARRIPTDALRAWIAAHTEVDRDGQAARPR